MTSQPKPYELIFEQRAGYLYVCVRCATMNFSIAREYLTEVGEKCTELDCTSVLIERDVPVMLPVGDLLFATDFFRQLMKGRRVAFVNPHERIQTDMQVAIIMGTNRGADYRLFPTVEAAEKWLLG